MAPRANWKGFLTIGELSCPVALFTAASASERIAFHTINRNTGHRVRRQFVDIESGRPVAAEDQVKGYEVGDGDYVMLEPEEVAAAVPESDKTLAVEAFVGCAEVDDVYLDKPYYLAPAGAAAQEAFAVIREGLRSKDVAALARAVLFRRVRTVLILPHDCGLIGTTLKFDYEVRPAAEAFSDIGDIRIPKEMRDLAKHILETKRGVFEPAKFEDRYEAALAELVKAKRDGKPIPRHKPAAEGNVIDLMEALRQSAGKKTGPRRPSAGKPAQRTSRSSRKAKAAPAKKKTRAGKGR